MVFLHCQESREEFREEEALANLTRLYRTRPLYTDWGPGLRILTFTSTAGTDNF